MPYDAHLAGFGPKRYVGDLEMSDINRLVRDTYPDAHGAGACGGWSWVIDDQIVAEAWLHRYKLGWWLRIAPKQGGR